MRCPSSRRVRFPMSATGSSPSSAGSSTRCARWGSIRSKQHRKCAGVIGEVLKSYHPHGDSSVYDALVRMAQDFTLRYPLVDGHGNFGSPRPDPPAAYRYTEARLRAPALDMLADIDKETVDFVPNFDNQTEEPVVLPARLPQLLVNGSSGIAVGMATNIPPHNAGEICDAIGYLIENAGTNLTDDELDDGLADIVQGPDFPERRDPDGTRGDPPGLQDRPRFGDPARQGGDRRGEGPLQDRHQRDPVSDRDQPRRRRDRRSVSGKTDRRDHAPRRRVESQRHAHRRRAGALGDAASRAEPALQADAAAVELRVQHAGAGAGAHAATRWSTRPARRRRSNRRCSACADAQHFIAHRKDVVRRRATYDLRKAARARAPARRLPHRARQHRRGHRDRARQPDGRRCASTQPERAAAFGSPSRRQPRSSTCACAR